jgi:hypothetical protein
MRAKSRQPTKTSPRGRDKSRGRGGEVVFSGWMAKRDYEGAFCTARASAGAGVLRGLCFLFAAVVALTTTAGTPGALAQGQSNQLEQEFYGRTLRAERELKTALDQKDRERIELVGLWLGDYTDAKFKSKEVDVPFSSCFLALKILDLLTFTVVMAFEPVSEAEKALNVDPAPVIGPAIDRHLTQYDQQLRACEGELGVVPSTRLLPVRPPA